MINNIKILDYINSYGHSLDLNKFIKLKKLPYTETSVWVNWLLENEDNAFAIKQFLHMVNTSTKSEGKKNTYLTGADALINNMTRILNGQYTTVSTGTSSTQHYLQGPENLDSGVEYLNGDITFSNNKVVFTFQNYIKAGNLIQASLNLKNFQNTFNKDLIYKKITNFNSETNQNLQNTNIEIEFSSKKELPFIFLSPPARE